MAFDGLMTYTIEKELENVIVGGKIDKIHQPNNHEILLGIYHNGTKYALDIVTSSNNYRLCLTTHAKSNPNFAPNFCMVLRKHLLNSKITKIETLGLERLVIIEFEGNNKSGAFSQKKLIIELMGKHSNIILVNSDGNIIDALKHFDINSNSYRNIIPNSKYTFPICNKLDIFNIEDSTSFYTSILECHQYTNKKIPGSLDLSNIVSETYTGISKSSILSFIENLQIENVFNQENTEKIYNYIKKILINYNYTHCILKDDSYHLETLTMPKKDHSFLQANFCIDDYYFYKESNENYTTYKTNFSKLILNHLKKLNNRLVTVNTKIQDCKNMNTYKLYGELITNNLYRIDSSHCDNIMIENYYDNNNLISIPLDKSISPSENAKKYFKKYHKLKNAKAIVEEQKEHLKREIDYLESIIYELQISKTIDEIDNIYHEYIENSDINHLDNKQKKKNKSKSSAKSKKEYNIGEPIKYIINTFTILIGKNNKQNDYITKHASSEDLWFHTKDIHGSHVILKTNSHIPDQETINKCASLAAFYSKAKQSDNVSVDYTYIKYVKKPSQAKPGMVIYTNNKTVIVTPKQTP